ncbi:MAG: CapA family protein [Patescibacteria group bacterium]
MRNFYFSIFILILSLVAGSAIYFGQEFSDAYSSSLSSNLQANLSTIRVNEILNQSESKQQKEINIVFVGDIMLGRGVENIWRKYGDSRFSFLKIAGEINRADLAFGNLEGPISERGTNHKIKYSFRFASETVDGLKFAGFDVLSLANNHIFDWGRDAIEDTVSILKTNGIESVGAGKDYLEANNPVIKEIGDIKIAFFAYSNLEPNAQVFEATKDKAGRSSFDSERIKEEIYAVKQLEIADIVIVSFHWGEEYQQRSNKKQQEIGRSLVESGADLIVGHHPHVVQEIERYKNGWIAYSLGNFIFDQNFSEETMKGLLLKVKIQNKKIIEVEPIEVKINDSFQPEIGGL